MRINEHSSLPRTTDRVFEGGRKSHSLRKKVFFTFFDLRAPIFFLPMKRVFSCDVLPSKYSGRWRGCPQFDFEKKKRNSPSARLALKWKRKGKLPKNLKKYRLELHFGPKVDFPYLNHNGLLIFFSIGLVTCVYLWVVLIF